MLNILTSVFNWLKDSAHRIFLMLVFILVVLVSLIGIFLGLSKYPVTFHTTSTEIHDHLQITKDGIYVLRTQVDKEEGAVVSFSTRTYYNQTDSSSQQD